MVRRFICGVATSGLTKIFPTLFAQAKTHPSFVEGVRHALRDKSYPRDAHFRQSFVAAKLYGGERSAKAKLILERLERSFGHKEAVDLSGVNIEHILPQTPTDWWQDHLGEGWEAVHEEWLHTIGNLTLTGYNSELSNSDFPIKQKHLSKSHLEINRYFAGVEKWDESTILQRGELLADRAVHVWPDFAHRDVVSEEVGEEAEDVQEDIAVLVTGVLDRFGGEVKRTGTANRIFYHTADGKVVVIKHSKKHRSYYWFGFHASLQNDLALNGVTHVVFILVPDRFVTVPVATVRQYLSEAGSSLNSDRTVRHFHVLISIGSKPELFHHGKPTRIPLTDMQSRFE